MPTPENGGNWGVLGGTFDPVHNGHLNLANRIYEKKSLDGVLFVLSYNHPLKETVAVADFEHRAAMLEIALANYPEFMVTQIEKLEKLSGFTIDTLQSLKKRFAKANFHFIIGEDLVGQLDKWHRSDELLSEFSFLVGGRPGADTLDKEQVLSKHIEVVEIEELDISAHNIRERISTGASKNEIKSLLPDKVADYIFEKKLYQ